MAKSVAEKKIAEDTLKSGVLKMECTDCGGILDIVDKSHAVCPHCGQKYRVDGRGGLTIDVKVDTKGINLDSTQIWGIRWLVFLLGVALFSVLMIFIVQNMDARKSRLSSSEQAVEDMGEKEYLEMFFEDVFDKEYEEITPEEFASIKYIRFEKNYDVATLSYSLADYRDCETESEFQQTIQEWTHVERMGWLEDLTDFTGLTRIYFDMDSVPPGGFKLAENVPISCVYSEYTKGLESINTYVNPENIEVLHILDYTSPLTPFEQAQNYPNLKELVVEGPLDATNISICKNLEKLHTKEAITGVENIVKLTNLKSLSLGKGTVWKTEHITDLAHLEELSICVEDNTDLSFLAQLPKLKKLDLLKGISDSFVDSSEIKHLQGVEELSIYCNQVESLEEFAKLQDLKNLDLYLLVPENARGACDISSLGKLPFLEELKIHFEDEDNYGSNVYVWGLEELLSVLQMNSIYIENADFVINTEEFEKNDSLREIKFKSCHMMDEKLYNECVNQEKNTDYAIISMDFLGIYSEVEVFAADYCDIADISFLAEFSKLKYCSLALNDVTDYTPLEQCRYLEMLQIYASEAKEARLPAEVKILELEDYDNNQMEAYLKEMQEIIDSKVESRNSGN